MLCSKQLILIKKIFLLLLTVICLYMAIYTCNHVRGAIISDARYIKLQEVKPKSFPEKRKEIPNVLVQTYISWDKVPEKTKGMIKQYSKGYDYKFFDDNQCISFLNKHYGDNFVKAFTSFSGPHKADLFRYCYLYLYGGIYIDIKTIFKKQLSEIFTNKTHFYTVLSSLPESVMRCLSVLHPYVNKRGSGIYQGIIACPPNHPLMLKCLQHMITIYNTYGSNVPYLTFCHFLYYEILKFTGHSYDIDYGTYKNITLFREQHTNNCEHRDRHILCRINILNQSGEVLFYARDPTFGKKW